MQIGGHVKRLPPSSTADADRSGASRAVSQLESDQGILGVPGTAGPMVGRVAMWLWLLAIRSLALRVASVGALCWLGSTSG
jgi:hypothetical protein